MADAGNSGKATAWLVLEYIRTFTWPTLVCVLLLVYKDDVVRVVETREVDLFGVRIGQVLPEIKENLQAELDELRGLANSERLP